MSQKKWKQARRKARVIVAATSEEVRKPIQSKNGAYWLPIWYGFNWRSMVTPIRRTTFPDKWEWPIYTSLHLGILELRYFYPQYGPGKFYDESMATKAVSKELAK